MQARLVDTNVLIVASAVDEGSPFRADATPVEEAALRQQVFDWLEAFEADSTRHAVLVPLDVDEFGAVRNWPPRFFGDAIGEAREQARARAQRLRESAGG